MKRPEANTARALLPCPFCGSTNIDTEGWASTDRSGPACDDCGATADTVLAWNTRAAPPLDREEAALRLFAFSRGESVDKAAPKWADTSPLNQEHFRKMADAALGSGK